ncbi:cellulase family glycosylhydrolase [Paenibacillus xylanexedens]|uniref:cellulase family glycosylhydrolase n=1 Tax=Paenibacillus xylanexedens TaxID=528191 RepID=UPI000FB4CD4D|nr:cellulase family glycosylhydrolase [Paenibacillus xylanexedens]RPK31415.1 Endo-1,4-beta-xylanase A precursor [Paenibacillus xylanexedens]
MRKRYDLNNSIILFKRLFGIIAVLIIAGGLNTEASVVKADGVFMDLSQSQIVAEMGAGWNLGNQLEASTNGYPSETAYGNPIVTEDLIKAVKAAGFKTVRIPVSWLNYIGPGPYYSIDYSWMTRVKEVVDYVVDNDMYAIIDLHNDGAHSVSGSWILTDQSDQDAIRTKFSAVWYQIATTFKDYDEHLIFESMNEVGVESANDIIRANQLISSYNQVFVDTVRVAGGNNDKRWLVVPGWITNIDYTTGDYGFTLPMDYNLSSQVPSGEKRIMVSAHYYTPWEFAGSEDDIVTQWGDMADPGKSIFWANEDYLNSQFYKLYDKFTSQGYPVVLGEYGSIDKSSADAMNTDSRAYYANTLSEYAKIYGCVPIIWDNGFNGNYGFGLFDRQSASYPVTQPEIIGAIMYYYGNSSQLTISLNKTSMTLRPSDEPVTLTATLTPAGAGDWVEWSSSNSEVASVDRFGVVEAKTAGTTVIRAAINGQSATSTVTVLPYTETTIYEYNENNSGTDFSTSDTTWFTDAYDRDLITIKYAYTDVTKAGWNILGWGATVSGTWGNGPVYAASTTEPTGITSVTTTVGELKTALGISSGSEVSFLQLVAYNSGQLREIKLIQW